MQRNAPGGTAAGSIDVHAHWSPPTYLRLTAELGGRPRDPEPLNMDLDARLRYMDSVGVGVHVLTLSGNAPWNWVAVDSARSIAEAANDDAIRAHLEHPDRFLVGATIPVVTLSMAIAELERVAGSPGVCAVNLPTSLRGHDYIFDVEFRPFLAMCQELGYPLLFHPLGGDHVVGLERLDDASGISNSIGFPFENTITAAKFITSGTLDKFPELEIVLPHSGGAFPYVAGRIDHGMARRKIATSLTFRDYMRRFHYDSMTFYPETLQFLIGLVGSDRVVVGSDNFAIMDVREPNALIEALELPEGDQALILRENARRLFGLPEGETH